MTQKNPWVRPVFKHSMPDGRELFLEALAQWPTYHHWSTGYPERDDNDRLIAAALEKASRALPIGMAAGAARVPHLIPPDVTPIVREGGEADEEYLPVVTCCAHFLSFSPARDPNREGSELSVLWYQDRLQAPFTPEIGAQLSELDWTQLAHDIDL